jgi:hypothetical protein
MLRGGGMDRWGVVLLGLFAGLAMTALSSAAIIVIEDAVMALLHKNEN